MKENIIISTLRKEIRESEQRLQKTDTKLQDTDNRIITKLFDLEDRVGRVEEVMATKDDIHRLETTLEGLVTIVKKMDSDRYALIEWLKRHDIHLENLDMSITALEA